MKCTIVLILLLAGCQNKYPRIVHNACSSTWAIQTGSSTYYGTRPINWEYYWLSFSFGRGSNNWPEPEKVSDAPLGSEIIFPDSLSADNMLQTLLYIDRWMKRDKEVTDSMRLILKARKDSLFKCQHTYK